MAERKGNETGNTPSSSSTSHPSGSSNGHSSTPSSASNSHPSSDLPGEFVSSGQSNTPSSTSNSQVSSGQSNTPSSTGTTDTVSGSSSGPSSGPSSCNSSNPSSFQTVPPVDDMVDGVEPDEAASCWGRLLPLNGNLYKEVSLQKDSHVFGRGKDCDYIFEYRTFRNNAHFQSLSKSHFKIIKESHTSDSNNYTVFLQDTSSNGTFLNGVIIGSGKKKVMKNNDEISLATKNNKAFIFFDLGDSKSEQEKYPQELKEKYTITKLLGVGACGEVRLAFQSETNLRFAVKIISKKKFSVGPQMPKPAIEEATILRKLKHPGIIQIEEVYDFDDTLYIILEYACGGELLEKVRKIGAYEEPVAKLLFYQMLLAVDYLHQNGITHRDLKPENVLLTSDNLETAVKITDFGLSRFVDETSLMKTLCGTPNYLAPEILKSTGSSGGYSKSVDCWSLGCILYICLGGYPPFSDDENKTLFSQILTGDYTFPDKYWGKVSADAKGLIKQLLVVDPEERISVFNALKHPWLQDEKMIASAERFMNQPGPDQMPPPPIIPAVRKAPADESESDSPDSKRTKLSSDETERLTVSSSTGF